MVAVSSKQVTVISPDVQGAMYLARIQLHVNFHTELTLISVRIIQPLIREWVVAIKE